MEAKFPTALRDFEDLMKNVESSTGTSGSQLPVEIAPELAEKDRPVLAAAIHHHCQILLTGDKAHIGSLYGQTIEGVEIHSPAGFAVKLRR